MRNSIIEDIGKGRYKEISMNDIDRSKPVTIMRPIDQSYRADDGTPVKKFRCIYDARESNAEFSYKEKLRILGSGAIKEIATLLTSSVPEAQFAQQLFQKKKPAPLKKKSAPQKKKSAELFSPVLKFLRMTASRSVLVRYIGNTCILYDSIPDCV